MKHKSLKISLIGLALVALGTLALSQTVKRARWEREGMFGDRALTFFTQRLDLSDAQQAQAKEIMAKEKPVLQPLMQQLGQTRRQLRQFEQAGTFDEAKVRAIATQQSQTLTELTVQRVRIQAELVQILTPEQKTKLNEMMAHHGHRMKQSTEQPQDGDSHNQ